MSAEPLRDAHRGTLTALDIKKKLIDNEINRNIGGQRKLNSKKEYYNCDSSCIRRETWKRERLFE